MMQALYALPLLRACYISEENADWVSTQYNKQMKELFIQYQDVEKMLDASVFIESAVRMKTGTYDYVLQNDPKEFLKLIFEAFLSTQVDSTEEGRKHCNTLLGSLITCRRLTCSIFPIFFLY